MNYFNKTSHELKKTPQCFKKNIVGFYLKTHVLSFLKTSANHLKWIGKEAESKAPWRKKEKKIPSLAYFKFIFLILKQAFLFENLTDPWVSFECPLRFSFLWMNVLYLTNVQYLSQIALENTDNSANKQDINNRGDLKLNAYTLASNLLETIL